VEALVSSDAEPVLLVGSAAVPDAAAVVDEASSGDGEEEAA
jgi:hypothetical protein